MDSNLPEPPKGPLHAADKKIKSLEESALAWRLYRNSLLPISGLPTEILSIIFSLLPSIAFIESSQSFSVSPISHVCHRWREISLNLPHLWSHINFNRLTLAGTAEMLTRSKMSPLHLEVFTERWWTPGTFEAIKGQIKAHIHHTRHFTIAEISERLNGMFDQLVSSAPSLEQFTITNKTSHDTPVVIPNNLFDRITPKLIYLHLTNYGISWGSPLLKGLRELKLTSFPSQERTTLKTWLDALSQMPRLEKLTLHYGVPIHPMTRQPRLTVVLSSITDLDIFAPVLDCIAVLAPLVLPALTRLRVNTRPYHPQNIYMLKLIPYVARNAHGPQDIEALQSLFIGCDEASLQTEAGIVAWTRPRGDTDGWLGSKVDLSDRLRLARVAFSTRLNVSKSTEEYTPLHDALLTALPLNSITSLTVDGCTPLNRQLWHTHAPRWLELERIRLFPTAVPAFREMLEDAPRGGPLLPSLEELVLVNVFLNAQRAYYLYDMLIELVELEIPIRTLDLRLCTVTNRAVKLLSEIVVDVQGPVRTPKKLDLDWIDFGEEASEEEETDEEYQEEYHGFNDVPPFLGSWNIVDDDDDDSDLIIN